MGLHVARVAELIAAMADTQNEVVRTVKHLSRAPYMVGSPEQSQQDRAEVAMAAVVNLAVLSSKKTSGQLYALSDMLDEIAALMRAAPW